MQSTEFHKLPGLQEGWGQEPELQGREGNPEAQSRPSPSQEGAPWAFPAQHSPSGHWRLVGQRDGAWPGWRRPDTVCAVGPGPTTTRQPAAPGGLPAAGNGHGPSTTLPGEWGQGRGREPVGDGTAARPGSPLLLRVPGDSPGRWDRQVCRVEPGWLKTNFKLGNMDAGAAPPCWVAFFAFGGEAPPLRAPQAPGRASA